MNSSEEGSLMDRLRKRIPAFRGHSTKGDLPLSGVRDSPKKKK